MTSENNPGITPTKDGPYLVKGLEKFASQKGSVEIKETMALCRCGKSENKPFCDGTHNKIGFTSAKEDGRLENKRDNYVGKSITIHDNRGICAHAGYCTDKLAAVFHLREEPWIYPDSATREEIIDTIKACPSGALSYTFEDVEHRDQDRQPSVFIAPNGPYVVSGSPDLNETKLGEEASSEHFTLCRCGGSKNKPFCDGAHWSNGFADDKN